MTDSGAEVAARTRFMDRLRAVRRQTFVGREAELDLFRQSLRDPDTGSTVLFIHGPGGIGKTTLLHQFRLIAEEAGIGALMIDGRTVDASPKGVLLALCSAVQAVAGGDARAADGFESSDAMAMLAALPRIALLIDTCETLAPVDGWLRSELLPSLPGQAMVVLAGRNVPSSGWRTEPGWRDLVRIVPLRNLSPEESRDFLRGRGVADKRLDHALELTHGHPLALSLVAEVLAQGGDDTRFVFEHEPDVVRVLLEKFVEHVPDALHRQALRLAAQVRVVTESLLAAVLPDGDAAALFGWLTELSFMEAGPHGLYPHDLAREVLEADFRWRDPSGYWDLLVRARDHTAGRVREARGIEQQRAFFDLTFLTRDLPFMKPYFEWRHLTDCYAEPAGPGDLAPILDIVRRHEGQDSARIAEYWFSRQPKSFTAIRGANRELIGFLLLIELHEATPEDLDVDPGARAAWEYAHRISPPRPGEEMLDQRMWMDRDAYHFASVTFLVIASIMVATFASRPRLAWTFHPSFDPDGYWEPYLTAVGLDKDPELDFEIDGRRNTTWFRDWRTESIADWIAGVGDRMFQALRGETPQRPPRRSPLVVLSEPAFADAVRQALRDFTRPAALASNPLLRSRLVVDRFASEEERSPAVLQELLREAAEALRGAPRSEKFYRAIERTYLEPAPSQERAAEALGLPFNTYRYRLSIGIARITSRLWERELNSTNA